MRVASDQFKQFDQEIMLELITGVNVKYAQRFFDRFSAVYVHILKTEPLGQLILDQMYNEEDPYAARQLILEYIEQDPLDDQEADLDTTT